MQIRQFLESKQMIQPWGFSRHCHKLKITLLARDGLTQTKNQVARSENLSYVGDWIW